MHGDEATRVPEGRQLAFGTEVEAEVVCGHPFGMGLYVRSAQQYGHVDAPNVSDNFIAGPSDYPSVGSKLRAVVLGYSGSGQLRMSTRLKDLPGYCGTRHSGHLTVRVLLLDDRSLDGIARVIAEFNALGVDCEGDQDHGLIVLDVPPSTRLAPVKDYLNDGQATGRWDVEEGLVNDF